jgi:hypothetical protein
VHIGLTSANSREQFVEQGGLSRAAITKGQLMTKQAEKNAQSKEDAFIAI